MCMQLNYKSLRHKFSIAALDHVHLIAYAGACDGHMSIHLSDSGLVRR